ncbi:MAG: hypothetical protein R3F44_16795 [Candidatus Competibacteraceae bacterium]
MVLTDSGYRKHMERVRLRLAEAMMKTIARLKVIGIQPWLVPPGRGPASRPPALEGINAATIARSCLQEGVVLAPGNAFSQSLSAGDFLRFNVAQTTDDRIFQLPWPARFPSSPAWRRVVPTDEIGGQHRRPSSHDTPPRRPPARSDRARYRDGARSGVVRASGVVLGVQQALSGALDRFAQLGLQGFTRR